MYFHSIFWLTITYMAIYSLTFIKNLCFIVKVKLAQRGWIVLIYTIYEQY